MSQLCFDGFFRLTEIRKAERLDQLKTLSLFPTVPMLEEIENKYGDVVSLTDMNGAPDPAAAMALSRPRAVHAVGAGGGDGAGGGAGSCRVRWW